MFKTLNPLFINYVAGPNKELFTVVFISVMFSSARLASNKANNNFLGLANLSPIIFSLPFFLIRDAYLLAGIIMYLLFTINKVKSVKFRGFLLLIVVVSGSLWISTSLPDDYVLGSGLFGKQNPQITSAMQSLNSLTSYGLVVLSYPMKMLISHLYFLYPPILISKLEDIDFYFFFALFNYAFSAKFLYSLFASPRRLKILLNDCRCVNLIFIYISISLVFTLNNSLVTRQTAPFSVILASIYLIQRKLDNSSPTVARLDTALI